MLRWLTAGESHGPELVAILEGLPAGVPVTLGGIRADLARRKLGYGRGARQKFEEDELTLSGGVRFGLSMGSPIALRIGNTEWPRWVDVMSAGARGCREPAEGSRRAADPSASRSRRPGRHAEVRLRRVAQRSRARERARDRCPRRPRRGRAVVPRRARRHAGRAHAVDRSGARAGRFAAARRRATSTRSTPIRCAASTPRHPPSWSPRSTRRTKDGDTLGGVVEVLAYGVPPGLGSYVHWDRKIDAQLAAALMSIQAIKGVEIGDGFVTDDAPRVGRARRARHGRRRSISRLSDRAGGTEGGMTTGTLLRVRAGNEAHLDGAARASHRGCRDRARRPRRITSVRTSAPFPPRASSPRRWSRSCSPTRCSRSSAATRSSETRRNLRRLPRRDPGQPAHVAEQLRSEP